MTWRLWILGVFDVKKFSRTSEKLWLTSDVFRVWEMNLRDRDRALHKVHRVCDLMLSTRALYNIYVVVESSSSLAENLVQDLKVAQ